MEPPGRLLSSAPTPIRIAQPSEEIRLQLLLADLLLAPLMSQQMTGLPSSEQSPLVSKQSRGAAAPRDAL